MAERTDATRTAHPEEDTTAPTPWAIQLAFHPRGEQLGNRYELTTEPLVLGRKAVLFGDGVFQDEHMSRHHAVLERTDSGLSIRDTGSHNGTFVNGTRIESRALLPGDVIGLGRMLLLVLREPAPPVVPLPEGVLGESYAFRSVVASATHPGVRFPLVLLGATGAGKDTLAQLVHRQLPGSSAYERWSCGTPGPDLSATLGAFEAGTTVYVDGVDRLSDGQQLQLASLLEDNSNALCIIASTTLTKQALLATLAPQLAHRLLRWEIRVPSLCQRQSDITLLAAAFARQFSGRAEARVGPELMFRLLRHSWPGNFHEFEAIMERAAVESTGEMLSVFDELDAILASAANARLISTYGRVVTQEPFAIDLRGRWYTMPDGTRHNIERRKTLSGLLAVFVEARKATPGQALSVSDLLQRAWAEQRLLPRSGANRVYVAVTTLRKMGLKNLLVRAEGGYLLDPDVPLNIIND